MTDRLHVQKTYKLFIGGKFPRSESGRSIAVDGSGAHVCHASRKDLREAVEAARKALPAWSGEQRDGATAYLRAQVLYRMAEMLEGKAGELAGAIAAAGHADDGVSPEAEVGAAIDRLVHYAGWADKYQQVLGCANPVSGPYHNFSVPEPTGIVGVIAPDDAPLLALVSLIAPPLCAGCTVVALASEANPIPACVLAEVCATSDVPAGSANLLTGSREELIPHYASHRGIDAIHAAGVSPAHAAVLREGAAENLKRVVVRDATHAQDGRATHAWLADDCESPWWIEPFVETKTIWHPSSA